MPHSSVHTSNFNIPKPLGTDQDNVPFDLSAAADKIDDQLSAGIRYVLTFHQASPQTFGGSAYRSVPIAQMINIPETPGIAAERSIAQIFYQAHVQAAAGPPSNPPLAGVFVSSHPTPAVGDDVPVGADDLQIGTIVSAPPGPNGHGGGTECDRDLDDHLVETGVQGLWESTTTGASNHAFAAQPLCVWLEGDGASYDIEVMYNPNGANITVSQGKLLVVLIAGTGLPVDG